MEKEDHESSQPVANDMPQSTENNETESKELNGSELSQDVDMATLGLRRSARERVPRKRDIYEIDASIYFPTKKKKKSKPKPKKIVVKEKSKKNDKGKAKPVVKKGTTSTSNANSSKSTPRPSEPPIPSVNSKDWTANVPLFNADYRNQNAKISRMKNENMKAVPYAGDVVKVMAFINKFSYFFVSDLQSLSFQDFEVGLDLYPQPLNPNPNVKDIQRLYADYLPIKDVVNSQDKMNLLLLTVMDLMFRDVDTPREPQIDWPDLKSSSKKVFQTHVEKIRTNAYEWGYPKEWRRKISTEDIMKPSSALFENDDTGSPVDPKNPEILTPNIYSWPKNEPLEEEEDPLQTKGLQRSGILALEPSDRIIFLRTLVDWCTSYSPLLHNEIYILTHYKRDPPFGIQTQHVPRYMLLGMQQTFEEFTKLCNLIQSRHEIRSKKKHVKKQISEGKNDIVQKLEIIKNLKSIMKGKTDEEKLELILEHYDDWVKLFSGEIVENPLSNPFENNLYKLRSEEFFVGRVPHVGDFYIPRLQSYDGLTSMNTYTDLRTLDDILNKFESKKINSFTLFENDSPYMSANFKLLLFDRIALIQDTISGVDISNKNYWYEMCNNSATLLDFIDFIDHKIVIPPAKEKTSPNEGTITNVEVDNQVENGGTVDLETKNLAEKDQNNDNTIIDEKSVDSSTDKKEKDAKKKKSTPSNTINPLPKNSQFNQSRQRLKILQNYLRRMYPVLSEFEEMKVKYQDINPSKRQSRRSRQVNYKLENSDDEFEPGYESQ
ncbi:ISWI one complex protein 3 [Nakaseomyces bracarensis]|uniref:ISWI one complex protein 3 n=1 Tax=Nakaseomyces bracarensis TaxID=273131 RepID=A0ABR4NU99_9SACH